MNEMTVLKDSFDGMLNVLEGGDRKSMMELTGQSGDDSREAGLPRLSINYDAETDGGNQLKRGTWKFTKEGVTYYADKVTIYPYVRTFEWSMYDPEQQRMSCRSIQQNRLNADFPDTSGGNKCGRLTKAEEETLGEDNPRVLASRAASCNQIVYSLIEGEFEDYSGCKEPMKGVPVIAYFKRSGFRPCSDAIDLVTKNNKLLYEASFTLATKRVKSGSVVYYIPVFKMNADVTFDIKSKQGEQLKKFLIGIKASNDRLRREHVKAVEKQKLSEDEVDLAAAFEE